MHAAASPLRVDIDLFRGPLHTLLDLIERHELPVTRISLVEVTDQYLALVRESPALDLDLTAEFLHVAARLLLLKSVALLPQAVADDPGAEGSDDDLETRLLAYRQFRDAARLLAIRQEAGLRMYGRLPPASTPTRPTRVAIDAARLNRAAMRVLDRAAERDRARSAAPRPLVAFNEILRSVVERLRKSRTMRFHDLVSEAGDAIVAITMFLVMLELVRERRLTMRQRKAFDAIEMEFEADTC